MSEISISDSRVLLLGSRGLLGGAVYRELKKENAFIKGISGIDLTDYQQVRSLFVCFEPGYVINCAGISSGLIYSLSHPADIFHTNTIIPLNILKAAQEFHTLKVVNILASCAYNAYDRFLIEKDILEGHPYKDTDCHGYSKRNTFLASQYYGRQYDMRAICVCPPTLYGPNEPSGEKQKVVGGLIEKIVTAHQQNAPHLNLWGSGYARREILYVDDAAKAVILALKQYHDYQVPLNLASRKDYSIREIAETIKGVVGYEGEFRWDSTKPEGQSSKKLSDDRCKFLIDPYETTTLEEGIRHCLDAKYSTIT